MRKTLILLLVGSCCGWLTAAAENLVINPGFEAGPGTNDMPSGGWWLYQTTGDSDAKLDQTIGHSGNSSARLKAKIPSRCILVSPAFDVAPGDDLRFEAWARAEGLPTNATTVSAGIAFRLRDGRITQRDYFRAKLTNGDWSLISGTTHAPAEAVSAEAHLNYANAPGTVWFDDISAEVTSPVSFALVQDAKPWSGRQQIKVRVTNRRNDPFMSVATCSLTHQQAQSEAAVPPHASMDLPIFVDLNGVGSHHYKLTLADAMAHSTNAPLRALQGDFVTEPPLAVFPACPCYQIVGEGNGSTRVDARVNLDPAQRKGLKLAVELWGADDKPLQTVTTDADKGDFVGCNLKVPNAQPAVFSITASLLDSSGKQIATDKTKVHIIEKEHSVVTLGADDYLRVDGKPHFPVGLYSCDNFEEMKKADFTAGHDYPIVNGEADDAINPNERRVQNLLDNAAAHGMRAQIELPRKAVEQGKLEQVRRRIETFRHHPGLLCWGSEERIARETTSPENIAKLYALVHETDPDHPFVLGDSRLPSRLMAGDRGDFFPEADMDIGIWWWYPIPLHEATGSELKEDNLLQPPYWLTNQLTKKPLWIAIQAYQQPWKKSRFPTPAEYRCESYLSIISGVKGIWFYTGYGERDYLGHPAGLLNRPQDSHWDYVQKLVHELREFSPVVMSPRAQGEVALSPTNSYVEFTTREADGKIYVIAANTAPVAQNAQFSSAMFKDRQVRVLYETDPAQVEGEVLTDEFAPFGVHVYEFAKPVN